MSQLPQDYSALIGKQCSEDELKAYLTELTDFAVSTLPEANNSQKAQVLDAYVDLVSCYAETYLLWDEDNSRKTWNCLKSSQLYADESTYEDAFTVIVNLHPSLYDEIRKTLISEKNQIVHSVPERELIDLQDNLRIMEKKITRKLQST